MNRFKRVSKITSRRTFGDKAHRANGGFTMTEILVVIAIIIIMMAIAFIAFTQIQKNMQQRELDDTAKEIFIAAQNHLSAVDELGYIDKNKFNLGTVETDSSARGENGEEGVYFYIVSDLNAFSADSLLSQMLPTGSIDDTARTGGSYIIRYDANAGRVLDVFFAWKHQATMFSAPSHTFAFDEYATLMAEYVGDSADDKAKRQNYKNENIIIGYYGGEQALNLDKGELTTPLLNVVNADRLYAEITYNGTKDKDCSPEMDLIVTGVTSGKTKTLKLLSQDSAGLLKTTSNVWQHQDESDKYYVLLDDITKAGEGSEYNKHFANIFASSDDSETGTKSGLIPGEDIRVQVSVHTKTVLARTRKSNRVTENSLFASISTDVDEKGVARISSIRHLENLSGMNSGSDLNNISGFDVTDPRWGDKSIWNAGGTVSSASVVARQVQDISWKSFCETITSGDYRSVNILPQSVSDDDFQAVSNSTQVISVQGDTNTGISNEGATQIGIVKAGSFLPVIPKYNLTYDGGLHTISDVNVDVTAGNAGIFGELANSSVSNLVVVNPRIASGNGTAGSLVGTMTNTSVENVLAVNDASDDNSYGIAGSSDVGGLVGRMSEGIIEKSAVALRISSTSGNAGGFVGSASDCTITNSYSGGHTEGGIYSTTSYNVASSGGNAGGFAGSLSDVSVSDCYTTCSAQGSNYVGGFVGSISGGGISNSYATGLVGGSENKGAFIGSGTCGDFTSNNAYFELVNGKEVLASASSESLAGVVIADGDTASYQAWTSGESIAIPYDKTAWNSSNEITYSGSKYDLTLDSMYASKYQFKTISELTNNENLSAFHLNRHYGDWPALEIMVVNATG